MIAEQHHDLPEVLATLRKLAFCRIVPDLPGEPKLSAALSEMHPWHADHLNEYWYSIDEAVEAITEVSTLDLDEVERCVRWCLDSHGDAIRDLVISKRLRIHWPAGVSEPHFTVRPESANSIARELDDDSEIE